MPPPVRIRRAPEKSRGRVPPPPTLDDEPTLQLALGREGIGLEMSAPVDLGTARLLTARAKLVGLRFPLDVSGGVERFRHRRTALDVARIAIEHAAAERWLASMAVSVLSAGAAEVRLGVVERPVEEGVRTHRGEVRLELSTDDALVAFDVSLAAHAGGIVAFAHRLRAIGDLAVAPTAVAGRFLQRLATSLGGRAQGLRLEIADPSRAAVVQAFVARGARVPTRTGTIVDVIETAPTGFTLQIARTGTPVAPSRATAGLIELQRLVSDGDEALIEGRLDAARDAYLRALERAPRHKAVLTRLCELDASCHRVEAALTWLREAQRTRGATSGDQDDNDLGRALLAGLLHGRAGASGRSRGSFDRAAELAFDDGEARLAARAHARAAATCADDDPQLPSLLDRALSADPAEPTARWRRLRLRIAAGDDERALEDVQHLEAQARGREGRRAMLLRAASLWAQVGRNDHAIPAYERALRYTPDDRLIVAGLGGALISAGESGRGVTLLARALELPGDDDSHDAIVLDLARALEARIGDAPGAIARLQSISPASPRAPLACLLEGGWRAQLGDRVGADRAFARAADHCERRGVMGDDVREVRGLLCAAARLVRGEGDLPLAQRLAMAALTVDPHDAEAGALVRELGQRIVPPEQVIDVAETHDTRPPLPMSVSFDESPSPPHAEPGLEARAEELLGRVKANAADDAAIEELVDVLSKLNRDFELYALLAARYEEASDDERKQMLPRQRAVLERLSEAALKNERPTEAALYRDAARALG